MTVFTAFAIVVVLGASCDVGAPPESPKPTPVLVPPADARTVDPPPVDADLSYPKDWILTALGDNSRHACMQLIYKHGCSAVRTGRVELNVTLDDQGKVAAVRTRSVEISLDPHVVEQCLLREVPKWQFHPPEQYARDLVLSVTFADKC